MEAAKRDIPTSESGYQNLHCHSKQLVKQWVNYRISPFIICRPALLVFSPQTRVNHLINSRDSLRGSKPPILHHPSKGIAHPALTIPNRILRAIFHRGSGEKSSDRSTVDVVLQHRHMKSSCKLSTLFRVHFWVEVVDCLELKKSWPSFYMRQYMSSTS